MFAGSTAVADRVREALADDPRTNHAIIEVTSSQGIVTLSGTVNSVQVSDVAEEIARQTPGVVSVVNELKVR